MPVLGRLPDGLSADRLSGAVDGLSDPQTDLHTDTFHPTVKAWLFLTDVAPETMPFVYVPGRIG